MLKVPFYIHWSVYLFLALVAGLGGFNSFLVLLMAYYFIILHEYGHVCAAQWLGYEVSSVNLTIIGGYAEIPDLDAEKPWEEVIILVAGPAVNLFLLAVFATILLLGYSNPIVHQCAILNVGLAVFNLLPIFPMDGGRILRAFLTIATGSVERATYFAVRTAQVLSIIMAALGLILGIFIWIPLFLFLMVAAAQELDVVRGRRLLQELREECATILGDASVLTMSETEFAATLELLSLSGKVDFERATKGLSLLRQKAA